MFNSQCCTTNNNIYITKRGSFHNTWYYLFKMSLSLFNLTTIIHLILLFQLTYPFAHGKTFITVATAGLESMQSATLGNIQNPAYFCTLFHDFTIPMNFWQRFANVFFSIAVPLQWRYQMVIPKIQKEVILFSCYCRYRKCIVQTRLFTL